jgi:hypothetical protein
VRSTAGCLRSTASRLRSAAGRSAASGGFGAAAGSFSATAHGLDTATGRLLASTDSLRTTAGRRISASSGLSATAGELLAATRRCGSAAGRRAAATLRATSRAVDVSHVPDAAPQQRHQKPESQVHVRASCMRVVASWIELSRDDSDPVAAMRGMATSPRLTCALLLSAASATAGTAATCSQTDVQAAQAVFIVGTSSPWFSERSPMMAPPR